MLDSALSLPLVSRISWGNALPPLLTLTPVDPSAAFDSLLYARRDRELAYRDLVIGAAAMQVSLQVSTTWGFAADRIAIPAIVTNVLDHSGTDIGATDTTVTYVGPTSRPYDAYFTDKDLYGRDVVLYETLARYASTLVPPPIAQIEPSLVIGPVWAIAEGTPTTNEVTPSLQLNTGFFKDPDTNLADRDNILAPHIVTLGNTVNAPWPDATRFSLEVQGPDSKEAENYVLELDSGTQRIWLADPHLPGRFRLILDKQLQTFQWIGSNTSQFHVPQPVAFSFPGPLLGQTIVLARDIPGRKDSQFHRQKSAQVTLPGTLESSVLLTTITSEGSTGGVSQFRDSSLTVPGTVDNIPFFGMTGTGEFQVSVLFEPTPDVNIPGSQTIISDPGSTFLDGGVSFPPAGGSETWQLPLPAGAWQLEITYTDVSGTPPVNFPVSITWDGGLIYNSPLVFGQPTNTLVTFTVGLVADGTPQALKITWTPGAGRLHVRKLKFSSAATTPVSYDLSATLDGATGAPIARIAALRKRPDVISFNFSIASTQTDPFLHFSWNDDPDPTNVPILIKQVQLQRVGPTTPTPNVTGFEYWKMENVQRAEGPVSENYAAYIAGVTTPPEFRQSDATHRWVWDSTSSEAFVSAIESRESRIRQAFRLSRPGDIGRPALVPDGLQWMTDGLVKANYGSVSTPTSTTATYVQPIVSNSVTVAVVSSARLVIGTVLTVIGAGMYEVTAVPDALHVTLTLRAFGQVASSGNTIASGSAIIQNAGVPRIRALLPWMITIGIYAAQEDFWATRTL